MAVYIPENENFKKFVLLAEQIQNIAQKAGSKLTIVRDDKVPFFLSLSRTEQEATLARLSMYEGLLEQIKAAGSAGHTEERQLLWYALRQLKLAPPSDMMDLLEENHLIEVYAGQHQIYRSFNYYDLCSYSIDELESRPWEELFRRPDSEILGQMLAEAGECLASRKILRSKTSPHIVEEIASAFNSKFLYKLDFIVPLKDLESNRQDCFLVALKAEVLETVSPDKQTEKLNEHFFKKMSELGVDL